MNIVCANAGPGKMQLFIHTCDTALNVGDEPQGYVNCE